MSKVDKKKMASIVLFSMFVFLFLGWNPVHAAEVNDKSVHLYFVRDEYKSKITIPEEYPTSYQIEVTGNQETPQFKLSSSFSQSLIQVSSTGLVTIGKVDPDSSGQVAVVEVTVDGEKYSINVYVDNYALTKIKEEMTQYGNQEITSNLSSYQKMEKVLTFVSRYHHDEQGSSSYESLYLNEGTPYYGLKTATYTMASLFNLGMVSSAETESPLVEEYMFAHVTIDNEIYLIGIEYDGSNAKQIHLEKTENGFVYRKDTLVGYEGNEEVITIPRGTTLGANFIGMNSYIREITIPNTVTEVDPLAFQNADHLEKIHVASDNPKLKEVDGVLYSKDGTTLIAFPRKNGKTSYQVLDGVTTIYDYLMYFNRTISEVILPDGVLSIGNHSFEASSLKTVNIPSSVTTIGNYAFQDSKIESIVLEEGVEQIGKRAFFTTSLKSLTIKNRYVELDEPASAGTIYGYEGSTAEVAASQRGLKFVPLNDPSKKEITKSMISGIVDKEYQNGNPITQNIVIQDGEYTLIENTDYKVAYSSNTEPGTALVTITGLGNYRGRVNIFFTITGKKITYTIENKEVTYNGKAQYPTVKTTISGLTILYQDKENSTTYVETPTWMVNPGTYTIKIKISGIGYETVTETVTFQILGKKIEYSIGNVKVAYTGKSQYPKITTNNPNLKVTYQDAKDSDTYVETPTWMVNPGTYTIQFKITGTGYETVTGTITFEITAKTLEYTIENTQVSYNGKAQYPKVKTNISGLTIAYQSAKDSDTYVETPTWMVNAGTYTIKIKISGTGYETKIETVTFTIAKAKIQNTVVDYTKQFDYTGQDICPQVTVKENGQLLTINKDYQVSYKNNKNVGEAQIIITGIGNYEGTKTLTFEIKDTISEETLVVDGIDYSGVFNYDFYLNRYKDIRDAYGNNKKDALLHFINYGMEEGRQGSEEFNVMYYKANYEDLADAYLDNLKDYYYEYIFNGRAKGNNGRTLNFQYYRKGRDFSKIFDLEYYMEQNPDVAKNYYNSVYGYDYVKIFEHFYQYGMQEGRNSISDFRVMYYKINNEDLYHAYQDNLSLYYYHYQDYGKDENRNGQSLAFRYRWEKQDFSKIFQLEYYMDENPDVKKAYTDVHYGIDYVKVFEHFYNYGIHEGRNSISSFRVMYYKANNPDLVKAYQNDIAAYYYHYQNYGAEEKRNAQTLSFNYKRDGYDFSKVLDLDYYIEHNKDVAKKFTDPHYGIDYVEVFNHFYYDGMKEGRQSSPTFDVEYYKKKNPDVAKAFGDDWTSYYMHYIIDGEKEGRIAYQK